MVIARNSSFQYNGKAVDIRRVGRELDARYVLEGSVRRSGDRVRITAQLIDAMTGAHRWAERYDRELHDVFAVQDEVVRAIVAILAAHVKRAETERALLKPPAAWEAYDYYLRGAEAFFLHQNRRTKVSLYDARRLLEQSLAIDPDYARAAAVLSWTHFHAYFEPFDGDYLSPAALDRALELAETAVHLDARLPQARAQLGHVLLYKHRHDDSIAEFERALALNPNFFDYRYARALTYAGEPARAIEVLEANIPYGQKIETVGKTGGCPIPAPPRRVSSATFSGVRCYHQEMACGAGKPQTNILTIRGTSSRMTGKTPAPSNTTADTKTSSTQYLSPERLKSFWED